MATALKHFDELEGGWGTLLLGNGASINICSDYSYASLYEKADLTAAAQKLFAEFETANFELVLERLDSARRVNAALGAIQAQQSSIDAEYAGIRNALFDAVHRTHVRYDEIPGQTFMDIAAELLRYDRVFTTNYDLLAYWSLQVSQRQDRFTDCFGRDAGHGGELTFNLTNMMDPGSRTQLLYLHGGLHLWYDDRTGKTGKWARQYGHNLLDLEPRYLAHPQRRALLVSEGTTGDKQHVISRSDYLSFALRELTVDASDIVVFGTSFSDQDQHIIDAVNSGPPRRIAVSIHKGGQSARRLEAFEAQTRERFENHTVDVFDAATHPLGMTHFKIR
ncbi:DUF4917 family protein [Catellatospora chokoriensis]|uniref:DUF4917 domain-containing protein n=1 Tax=Catellatospora chokoriensis TaxID=310353 RepID=A0A8J3JZD2_9ACTN|nr:DUF4917 family protein [Catellatospora chokoriensis]GIF93891.1 DUF4917 domain-containing protein [Catellatospora chokoriensis]